MEFVSRFRKKGGFLQLLQLFETSDPDRQKSLFDMLAKEDPAWAYLLRLKTLTVERILNWPPEVLSAIWPSLPLPLIVAIWQKSPTTDRQKIESSLPRSFRSSFQKAVDEMKPLDDAEARAAGLRLVAVVREMNLRGAVRFREFDPGLEFDASLAEEQDPFKKVA